jgi:hypothetical protein
MVLLLLRHPAQPYSVQPYPRNRGLSGPPRPSSDPGHPLRSEILDHLEEWAFQDNGDAFGELTLGPDVLKHLEDGIGFGEDDAFAQPIELVSGTDVSTTPIATAPDREHPLWDRELDG